MKYLILSLFINCFSSFGFAQQEITPIKAEKASFESLEKAYLDSLEKDTSNTKLNYQLAMLYYDKGVEIVNNIDYETADTAIYNQAQQQLIYYFKKAKPYFERSKTEIPEYKIPD